MKHLFPLLAALFVIITTSHAQYYSSNYEINDNMESYSAGELIYENWWTDWDCGGSCAIVASSEQAQSGTISGHIPGDGTTKGILDLGNQIFAEWRLLFYMYIPSNKEAHWNIQGMVPVEEGESVMGDFFFNKDLLNPGSGKITDCPNAPVSFTFPHDQWFSVFLVVDMSVGMKYADCKLEIAGNTVLPAGTPFSNSVGTVPTSLGGIEFFSNTTDCYYFIDDIYFQNPPIILDTGELNSKDFMAYPNPVNDILQFQAKETIDSVVMFNILGQEVYRAQPDALHSQIDMTGMASGAYFLKVAIGGASGTVKIMK